MTDKQPQIHFIVRIIAMDQPIPQTLLDLRFCIFPPPRPIQPFSFRIPQLVQKFINTNNRFGKLQYKVFNLKTGTAFHINFLTSLFPQALLKRDARLQRSPSPSLKDVRKSTPELDVSHQFVISHLLYTLAHSPGLF